MYILKKNMYNFYTIGRDGWSWLSGWVSHGECTLVYSYTLDKTYDES